MSKKKTFGTKEMKVLQYIALYCEENPYPPSIREIRQAVGISSTSVVNWYLDKLLEKDYIVRERKISRGLIITAKGYAAAGIQKFSLTKCPHCGKPLDTSAPVEVSKKSVIPAQPVKVVITHLEAEQDRRVRPSVAVMRVPAY